MKIRTVYSTLILLAASLTATAEDPSSLKLQTQPVLPMALAKKMVEACVEHQRENNGSPVAVAIYDDSARLIYFVDMDGSASGSGDTAMGKAESSARFRTSAADIGGWVKGSPGVGHIRGLLGVQGGLPIFTDSGEPLGGIGVSGDTGEVDENCAQAGIDAVRAYLKYPG